MRVLRFVDTEGNVRYGQARSSETDVAPGDKVPLLAGDITTGFKPIGNFGVVRT